RATRPTRARNPPNRRRDPSSRRRSNEKSVPRTCLSGDVRGTLFSLGRDRTGGAARPGATSPGR
ncbi:hypothetical protein, partial [Dietzia sp. CQ4]|uniref:hypothetical protein n=1 Tax=Dietzia sp. (strain CQ4) TaxID=370437 RepID=UPI0019D687AE